MTDFQKLRIFHAILAIACVLAYLTGEMGWVHRWIGYGVAVLIAFRLLWSLVGARQIGLTRLLPAWHEIKATSFSYHPAASKILLSGVIACLLTVTATGIALDQPDLFTGSAAVNGTVTGTGPPTRFSATPVAFVGPALADDGEGEYEGGEDWIEEVHEAFANLLFLFVGLHVIYILIFKRKLGLFMLFADKTASHTGANRG